LPQELHNPLTLLAVAGPRLHALLLRLTLRDDVAEELMQELFLKLNRSAAFARADDPIAYAHRAAMHLAFDWRRSARRRPENGVIDDAVGYDMASPLGELIRGEQLEQVLDALQRLSPLCREAFVLHYVRDATYEQAAAELGKTPHQVRALCAKAIAQLRERLDPKEDHHPTAARGGETNYAPAL